MFNDHRSGIDFVCKYLQYYIYLDVSLYIYVILLLLVSCNFSSFMKIILPSHAVAGNLNPWEKATF